MKYPFILRLFVLFPLIILTSVVWAFIGLFSTDSLGKVLKQTGENLLQNSVTNPADKK